MKILTSELIKFCSNKIAGRWCSSCAIFYWNCFKWMAPKPGCLSLFYFIMLVPQLMSLLHLLWWKRTQGEESGMIPQGWVRGVVSATSLWFLDLDFDCVLNKSMELNIILLRWFMGRLNQQRVKSDLFQKEEILYFAVRLHSSSLLFLRTLWVLTKINHRIKMLWTK